MRLSSQRSLWLAVLMLFSLNAVGTEVQVTDDLERTVTLASPAKRIVSLAPHVTELLFAAGADRQVVGVVNFSDYPEAAKKLPVVGNFDRLDYERILSLEPDLVVAWGSGNGQRQLDQLQELGLTLFVSEPRSLDDVAENLERLGILAGSHKGQQAAEKFREAHRELVSRYRNKSPVSVFYQIWDQPLMTVNGEHLISRIIELCGGRNVFSDLSPLAGQVMPEAVLARNPEVMISGDDDSAYRKPFEIWQKMPEITAVRHGHLFLIHPDLLQRHTPRILEGARQLCERLEAVRQARQD